MELSESYGDPSNIILGKDGFYYAALWNRNQVGLQAPGVCMMRTRDITDPASWRAWGGTTFDVAFADPYTMTPGTEAEHVCVVTNLLPQAGGCPVGGMVWSTYLNSYLASMACDEGFLYALSDDLIAWSEPTLFYSFKDLPPDVQKNVTTLTYPTVVRGQTLLPRM